MQLTIFNGSPKKGKSNTEALVNKMIEGIMESSENKVEFIKMNDEKLDNLVERFKNAEAVILAFPLYVYAMPGGVKEFIEALEPLCGKCVGKKIGFVIQYGFMEATHARPLEKYLEHLSKLLGCEYIGTVIKGGCDALVRHPNGAKATFKGAYSIGQTLGKQGYFDKSQLGEFSKPELQKKQSKLLMKIIVKLINRFYWEGTFKKNGVTYEQSFSKPYGE